MWCNILLLFIFGNIMIQTNAVNMCTGGSTASTDITLNLIKGTGTSGCNCSVKLNHRTELGSGKSKISFKAERFSGCKYKLVLSYNNINSRFSCDINNTIFHAINKTDEIKLYLEPTTSDDDTEFWVKITSSVSTLQGPLIRLECFPPNTTDTTALPSSSRTNTMIPSTPSPITMESTENKATSDIPKSSPSGSSQSSTTSTNTPITNDSITSISIYTTTDTSTNGSTTPITIKNYSTSSELIFESTTHQPTTYDSTNGNETIEAGEHDIVLDIGLIGGVVGGILILVVVIIVIIVCIVRRKKNGDKNYNKPTSGVFESGYTDINLQGNDTNSSKDGVPNNGGNPVFTQQSDNSEETGPIQMEIIDNELYVSSDDLDDFKSRDDNISNHNPVISNSKGEMEVIENERYVSSDDVFNTPSNDDNAPIYAVVNKKSKRQTSDSNNTSNGISQTDHVTLL